MTTKELLSRSIIQTDGNGIYAQHLIASEHSPLEKKDICGCWLLVFDSENYMSTWLEIYQSFMKIVQSNSLLDEVVCFEPIHKIDEFGLCLNRGFNEAYTTAHYAEFLEDGNCRPNEWILQSLDILEEALKQPYSVALESENQKMIMEGIMDRAFVQPYSDLKWTHEPFAWTLYIPPISTNDMMNWEKEKSE